MRMKLTQAYLYGLKSGERRIKIRDTVLQGLVLFVEPSGKRTWYIDYKRPNGKRTDHKLGALELFTVAEARCAARNFLASVRLGADPSEKKQRAATLKELVEKFYSPWFLTTHKNGGSSLRALQREFAFLHGAPLDQISAVRIERWRSERKQSGVKSATINRLFSALKAALNWAVKNGHMAANPIGKVEKLRERDSVSRVRYLSPEENERLMLALDRREERVRKRRGSPGTPFADYLKPMILVSLNTGIRRGALFSLEWRDVDFDNRMLTLRPGIEKSGKENNIPLNALTYQTLLEWRTQAPESRLIFPSPKNGEIMSHCQKVWGLLLEDAGIKDFRWHDMRHDFASQLVMKGADLNTVRELLGHSDLKMTLRYAHLAPKVKRAAVDMLG